jgi:RNA polymerase sigma-70 factor (ECF subfamily)
VANAEQARPAANTGPTDAELIDRIRKTSVDVEIGSQEGEAGGQDEAAERAFSQLYDRYFKRVYHFVDKRLNNRADVEETTQEVFINIFSSIDSYRGEAPFPAWVFGITRRVIAGRFKRKRHTMIPLGDDEPEQISGVLPSMSAAPSPLESYECSEWLARLSSTLEERLSPEQRLLFQLHHLEERPISEIAQTLQKSEDSVKSNLYRTRKLLLAR